MEKKNKKLDIFMKGLTVVTILGVGYVAGLYKGGKLFNDGLETLGKTGLTMTKIIDGKEYILSVIDK